MKYRQYLRSFVSVCQYVYLCVCECGWVVGRVFWCENCSFVASYFLRNCCFCLELGKLFIIYNFRGPQGVVGQLVEVCNGFICMGLSVVLLPVVSCFRWFRFLSVGKWEGLLNRIHITEDLMSVVRFKKA